MHNAHIFSLTGSNDYNIMKCYFKQKNYYAEFYSYQHKMNRYMYQTFPI